MATLAVPLIALACFVLVGAMLLFVRQIVETVNACDKASGPDPVVTASSSGDGAATSGGDGPTGNDAPGPGDPPENFIEAYFEAANQPDAQLGPEGPYILMAIHEIESGFGRSDAPGVKEGINYVEEGNRIISCCKGPFQFYDEDGGPSTWKLNSPISGTTYARDGDGDGDVDIYSNHDAMFAAGALLDASGAPEDWSGAILAYNNSTSYRDKVLSQASYYEEHVPPPGEFKPARADPEVEAVAQAAGCEPQIATLAVETSEGGAYSQPLPKRSFIVTGEFWEWRDGYNHEGTDLAAPEGTLIRAIGAGKVTVAGEVDGYGLYTCIEHTQRLTSCYGHQSKLEVEAGEMAEPGQPIGLVGTTGHSTGPHLHFEVYLDGVAVCPANYVGADPAVWCMPDAPGFDARPG